jgi:hypothetical protein
MIYDFVDVTEAETLLSKTSIYPFDHQSIIANPIYVASLFL